MPTVIYDTIDEVNNVMEQLPPEARAPTSGFMAKQLEDGTYELTVPNQWMGAVNAADPERPPPVPPRTVPKSLIISRLAEAGKSSEAFTALTSDPALFLTWFSADKPVVNSNDPDTIAFLEMLDVDPDTILAAP
jgi:hypothetical protein